MKRMVSLKKDAREKMGMEGRKHMVANFRKEIIVEETLNKLGLL